MPYDPSQGPDQGPDQQETKPLSLQAVAETITDASQPASYRLSTGAATASLTLSDGSTPPVTVYPTEAGVVAPQNGIPYGTWSDLATVSQEMATTAGGVYTGTITQQDAQGNALEAFEVILNVQAAVSTGGNPTPPPAARDWDWSFGPAVTNLSTQCTRLVSVSTMYVYAQVQAVDAATGLPQDPTSDTVQMAFTTGDDPQSSDWVAADWLDRSADGTSWARTLVPAGTLTQPVEVWVKITDSPETPVGNAGLLEVE